MEEGSKRRLVGTAVVVLLLVIFLPMLLEEEQANPVPDSDLEIPARPDFEADFDSSPAEPSADTFALPTTPELPAPDRYPAPMPESPPQLPPMQVVTPALEPVPAPTQEPEAVADPEPPAVAQPVPAELEPAPVKPKPTGNTASWVIQVSSLTERPRALSLERELRAKGFPAFIEKAEVGGKTYHRVRVGPEVARKDIEAMAASLRDKAGFAGQILRYP